MENEDNINPDLERVDPSEDAGLLSRDPGQNAEPEQAEEEGAEE